ncbi:methionine--tRNA ligase [Halobaculum sp. MBLA0147]|uniref:methionine--tRNA ligase n=1 Tax=Halobaculum sp. MBLA0147 TaxID=3079934 RepID=UPI003523D0FB
MSHEAFPTESPAVVTCGLPYANGPQHIGHLRTYVGGDVYSRALESLGQQTAFVCGSDMHGAPIAVGAQQEGVDPEAFATQYHEEFAETFPQFGVEFDNYGRTDDATNHETTRAFVREMEKRGFVYETEIPVAYDPEADQSLPDRFVEGTCPYCGERARGDECDEGCGRHLEPGEVEDPVSTITGNPAEYREQSHRYFRVTEFQEYLSAFLDRLEGTDNAQNQPREWVEGELRDWCITRDMDWGVDYPVEDGETDDLVLYVWVDAPIEYVSSTRQYTDRVGAETFDWAEAWGAPDDGSLTGGADAAATTDDADPAAGDTSAPADDTDPTAAIDVPNEGGEVVHVIGRDIIQHHTVFWPAMLRAVGYTEPRAVMASGFMTLGGKGFSTSRDRAVWASEYLEEGFHPDLLRYYLATNGAFQRDVDFSWEKFRERVNTELVGTVGNFLYRSLLFAHRNFETAPEVEPSAEVREAIETAIDEFETGVNDYSIRAVGEATTDLARFGNEYIQREEPWNLVDDDETRARQVIGDCVQIAKAIAVLFEPVCPDKSETLWSQLGEAGSVHDVETDAALEPPAGDLAEPTELFEKIEAERVEELNRKLEDRVAAATADDDVDEAASGETDETETDDATAAEGDGVTEFEPIADDRIGFEEFQELDLRVGEIEVAEPVADADDLMRLEVDIGVETRQIVAGIQGLHDADALPGTRVVVANLEPAELFGLESNGMVLAAGEQADLLTTHADAEPGTKIR